MIRHSQPPRQFPRERMSRILIVEDDRGVGDVFSRALSSRGYDVLVATTAETALNEVDQFQPDAILLDLRMPALSGLEFLRRMRTLERASLTPVAVITGDIVFVHANRQQLRELNADVYYKPVRLKDLLGITRSLLQKPS